MKRSFPFKQKKSTFCKEITLEARKSDALYTQLNLSDHEIRDINGDEEMVWALIRGEPGYFFNRATSITPLRASLQKIPYAFYYLLKYGYTNRFVLCLETSSFFSKYYRSFADLYKRAVRTNASTTVFGRLASFFSMDPDQIPWTLTKEVFLNAPLSASMFQHYPMGDAFGDFFRYEHNVLMKECRENTVCAADLADIYRLLYPFGCPNASYYTSVHQKLRAFALRLVVSLASSSVEELKIDHPTDVTKHDPLSLASSSVITFFIEEIGAVVDANRKLLLACMADTHPVRDDNSYELFLQSLLKAKIAAQSMLVQIDAMWLYKLVTERIKQRLPKDTYASYNKNVHLTQKNIDHLATPLFSFVKESLFSKPRQLYHTEVNGDVFDEALLLQIERSKECSKDDTKVRRKDTKTEDDLLRSLSIFIERSTYGPIVPLARTLYDEIRRAATEKNADDTPLVYWENHPSTHKDEKLQHLYQMLFLQCSNTK